MSWLVWLSLGLVIGGAVGAVGMGIVAGGARLRDREEFEISIWSAARRLRSVKCTRCSPGVMDAQTDGHSIVYRCHHCGLIASPDATIGAPVA